MELKFKRLSEKAILPIRAHKSDAGLDLTCTDIETKINECGQLILVYHTDLAVEIPEGYVGLLFPRSSISSKSLMQCNCVGVIDSGYRGEIQAHFKTTTDVVPAVFKIGERFGQLVIVPYLSDITITEAAELAESDRGEGGFGSTGTSSLKEEQNTEDSAVTGSDTVDAVDTSTTTEDTEIDNNQTKTNIVMNFDANGNLVSKTIETPNMPDDDDQTAPEQAAEDEITSEIVA